MLTKKEQDLRSYSLNLQFIKHVSLSCNALDIGYAQFTKVVMIQSV